jgi:hypothetical protein
MKQGYHKPFKGEMEKMVGPRGSLAYFKVLYRHFPGRNEESHRKVTQDSRHSGNLPNKIRFFPWMIWPF